MPAGIPAAAPAAAPIPVPPSAQPTSAPIAASTTVVAARSPPAPAGSNDGRGERSMPAPRIPESFRRPSPLQSDEKPAQALQFRLRGAQTEESPSTAGRCAARASARAWPGGSLPAPDQRRPAVVRDQVDARVKDTRATSRLGRNEDDRTAVCRPAERQCFRAFQPILLAGDRDRFTAAE